MHNHQHPARVGRRSEGATPETENKAPAFQFYPKDWRSDESLRSVSYSARGLWIEMLGSMWTSVKPGYLLFWGQPPTLSELARVYGESEASTQNALNELERKGLFSVDESGVIFCRRMVRDYQRLCRLRECGKAGGNPHFKPKSSNHGVASKVNHPSNPMVNHLPSSASAIATACIPPNPPSGGTEEVRSDVSPQNNTPSDFFTSAQKALEGLKG